MILLIYSVFLAFLIPLLFFFLPILCNVINYSYSLPQEILIMLVISLMVSIIFIGFHLNTTKNSCDKRNGLDALLNSLKVFMILLVWMSILDYFPTILEPFYSLFILNGQMATIVYKSIMIYGVVFLLLTYTNFRSVKNTCTASMEQIKQAYNILQKELVGTKK